MIFQHSVMPLLHCAETEEESERNDSSKRISIFLSTSIDLVSLPDFHLHSDVSSFADLHLLSGSDIFSFFFLTTLCKLSFGLSQLCLTARQQERHSTRKSKSHIIFSSRRSFEGFFFSPFCFVDFALIKFSSSIQTGPECAMIHHQQSWQKSMSKLVANQVSIWCYRCCGTKWMIDHGKKWGAKIRCRVRFPELLLFGKRPAASFHPTGVIFFENGCMSLWTPGLKQAQISIWNRKTFMNSKATGGSGVSSKLIRAVWDFFFSFFLVQLWLLGSNIFSAQSEQPGSFQPIRFLQCLERTIQCFVILGVAACL